MQQVSTPVHVRSETENLTIAGPAGTQRVGGAASPDADVPNGRISSYDVQTSGDGVTFTSAVQGSWDGTVDAKIARFPAGTTARYVRLVGLAGGADYAAATELNIALAPGS
ncbi:discoidin domain-containing protein [Kribbella sp. GL6]|uniref:discoidin domain-containing protein n=1 Tax=Kribbella sp. GL6 TaxID=3419765 RepID=UPI003D071AAD